MRIHELHRQVDVPASRREVFPFFADASNLEALTPAWLRFRILTPQPISMREGTRIDYRLHLRGMPMRWTSLIQAWEPPHRFVDVQQRGPYRQWIHEHRFEVLPQGGTRIIDHVRYAVPGGDLVRRLFVQPQLERIFDHRHRVLRAAFGGVDAAAW